VSSLAVTLIKSPIGNRPQARATVRAIGLRRLHQTVTLEDTESVRGMLKAVAHLISVSEGVPKKASSKPTATVKITKGTGSESKAATKKAASPAKRKVAKKPKVKASVTKTAAAAAEPDSQAATSSRASEKSTEATPKSASKRTSAASKSSDAKAAKKPSAEKKPARATKPKTAEKTSTTKPDKAETNETE